jgi:putative hydrolase of HD superfamily
VDKNTEDLRQQANSLIDLVVRVDRLADLPRTGWLFNGVEEPESIADHQYGVALISLWLSERLERDVELGKVYRISILHDVSEAMLTDLPKPVKKFIGSDAIESAEKKAEEDLLDGAPARWLESLEEYRQQETIEARIVKAADKIHLMAKSLVYRDDNRGNIDRFWDVEPGEHGFEDIPLVDAVFRELSDAYREGRELKSPL